MDSQNEQFAFEIGMIHPINPGRPLYQYTILMLKPSRHLFQGYGGDVREVRDTAKAHIDFLKANPGGDA